MRAAIITRPGGPEVLEVRERPTPTPSRGEVLVRVHASALNRADLLQRMGRYPAPPGAPADIPGLEIAGEIAELGADARRLKVGDRVFGIVSGGGHAEYVATRENEVAAIPRALDWNAAAAVPEAFMTAHDALVTQAIVKKGDAVVVHAIGSGVGLAASQLIAAYGARCYGTARTQDKIDRARKFGLTDGAVMSGDLDAMIQRVREWTKGKGCDIVLDLVGGDYLPASVECCAPLGRVILIGLMAGRSATVNLGSVLSKRVTVRGTQMRGRNPEEKAAVTEAFARDVLPLLENGKATPVIEKVFPLEKIADAHTLLESNETFGKVVISMSS